jgi:hypothetical protein
MHSRQNEYLVDTPEKARKQSETKSGTNPRNQLSRIQSSGDFTLALTATSASQKKDIQSSR